MTTTYREHEISVTRGKTMAGYSALFLCIVRQKDQYICLEGTSYCADTVRDMVATLKERIDNELADADPWMESEDRKCLS